MTVKKDLWEMKVEWGWNIKSSHKLFKQWKTKQTQRTETMKICIKSTPILILITVRLKIQSKLTCQGLNMKFKKAYFVACSLQILWSRT